METRNNFPPRRTLIRNAIGRATFVAAMALAWAHVPRVVAADATPATQPAGASSEYTRLLRQSKTDLDAGRYQEALASALQAVKLDEQRSDANAMCGVSLVRLGKLDDAEAATSLALAHSPDAKKPALNRLLEQIHAAREKAAAAAPATQQAPAAPAARPSAADRLALAELQSTAEDLQKAADTTSRRALLQELFTKSGQYVAANPKAEKVWELRAMSALELNRAVEAGQAGKRLQELGALDHGSEAELKIVARINRNGWIEHFGDVRSFTNSIGMTFVEIKPGEFLMGSPEGEVEHQVNETQHLVRLTKPFLMGVHHVTRGQFATFVSDSGYKTDAEKQGKAWSWNDGKPAEINGASWRNPGFEQGDDHPVVDVSWNDAVAFCDWLSKKEGKHYRLPTEAEWEYCSRARATTAYPWGDDPNDGKGWANVGDLELKQKLNFAGEWPGFKFDDGFVFTSPVGSFKANAFGLYDMIGNAWQWCSDGYGDYPAGPVDDPTGLQNATSRVLRGGSWNNYPQICRCAYRFWNAPDYRNIHYGFRVALDF